MVRCRRTSESWPYIKPEISIELFGITKTVGRKGKYSGRSDHTRINTYAATKSEGVSVMRIKWMR